MSDFYLPDRAPHCPRWLHVVPHLDPAFGGLSSAVPDLVAALNRDGGCAAELAAFCSPDESWPALPQAVPVTRWPLSRREWMGQTSLRAKFREHLATFDGVHVHGLWEQSTLMATRVARALGKPYVVSAHGMLDPWALRNKRLKKTVYAALIERANLRGARALHALTAAEAEDYRGFLQRDVPPRIAVIPNGVTIPDTLDQEPFLARFPELRGRRLILFLGRIHYKKGVDTLIRAWGKLASVYGDAQLVLAGPDSEGTLARAEALISELGLEKRVTLTGMLRGEQKWSALASASVFILPSLSEGLSVSVLEAMGTGLPVIVTPGCHLPEVSDTGAGWMTQSEVKPLASSIESFLLNPLLSNQYMGARGRRLVEQKFSWGVIARNMAALYQALASPALCTAALREPVGK